MDREATATHGPKLVGLLVFAVALWAQTDAHVGLFVRDGLNLVLGKALARGEGLVFLHLPGAPTAAWTPPLYPYLLSFVGRLWQDFPANLVLIQILNSALLAGAAWMVMHQLRRLDVPPVQLAAFCVFGFLSPFVLRLATSSYAEPLLLALAAAAILLTEEKSLGVPGAVATGLVCGLAALTTETGAFVILGVATGLFARKNVLAAVVCVAGASLVLLPWIAWSVTAGSAQDLAASLGEPTATRGDALSTLVSVFVPTGAAWIRWSAGAIGLSLVVYGVFSVWRATPAFAGVVVAGLATALLFPADTQRTIWVMTPWLLVLASVGAYRAWGMWAGVRIPVGLVAMILLGLYLPATAHSVTTRAFAQEMDRGDDFRRMLISTLIAETPEGAVIATDKQAMVHLYTARATVPILGDRADRVGVDTYCRWNVTHIAPTTASIVSGFDFVSLVADSVVVPIFELTDGPRLYELRCPT